MRLKKCPEVAVSAVPASSRKEEHETQRINVPIQDGRAISLTGINLETRSWVGDMVLALGPSSHISIKSSPGPSGGLTVFLFFASFRLDYIRAALTLKVVQSARIPSWSCRSP